MNKQLRKQFTRDQRKKRVRTRISGTSDRPRLSVRRTLNYIYAQLIDDTTGTTLVYVTDKGKDWKGTKTEKAQKIGEEIAKLAKEKGITTIVFDRGASAFHGRVKALADAARSNGLTF